MDTILLGALSGLEGDTRVSLFEVLFQLGSHIGLAPLQFAEQLKVTLNSWSSFLCLPHARVAETDSHPQITCSVFGFQESCQAIQAGLKLTVYV